MRRRIRLSLLLLALWCIPALASNTPFTANLTTLSGGAATQSWLQLDLRGCGQYILQGGGVYIPKPLVLRPNGQGVVTSNVVDEGTYVCGGVVGTAYYHITVFWTDNGKTVRGQEADYDITGSGTFNLNTATPKNSYLGGAYVLPPADVNSLGGIKGSSGSLSCAAGSHISGINSDGSIHCTADSATGTITGITTASGSGLQGGGSEGTLNLALGSCPNGQTQISNGSGYACGTAGQTYTLPALTATVLGGVKGTGFGLMCDSGYVVGGFNSDGSIDCVVDQVGGGGYTLPALDVSVLGGVKGTGTSLTCPAGQHSDGFGSDGTLNCTLDTVQSVAGKTGTVLLTEGDIANLVNDLANKAPISHSHPESQITNLVADLAAKAADSAVVHNSGSETVAGTKTFSSTITGSITGNAATATALAANGTNCSSGYAAQGVDAQGNAEGCTSVTPPGAAQADTLGMVKGTGSSLTCGTGYVSNGFNSDGSINCVVDQTGGGSYTLPAAQANTLGGVMGTGASLTCAAGQHANGFQSDGKLNCTADPVTSVAGKTGVVTLAEADVASLVTDLAGKSAVGHGHAESDVTNLVTDLAGKAPTVHTHSEAQVTNLTTDLAAKANDSSVVHNAGNESIAGTKTFSSNIVAGLNGNASTATALAANGTNCSAGSAAAGIDTGGNAEGCTAYALESTAVHKTGTETVAGAKTFSDNLSLGGSFSMTGSGPNQADFLLGTTSLNACVSGHSGLGFDTTTNGGVLNICENGVSYGLTSALALKAPLISPTFTGSVTVPSPTISTQAATKGYVDNQLGAQVGYRTYKCTTTNVSNAYACTISVAYTAYTNGDTIHATFNAANTGAATLNLNSLGDIPIRKQQNGAALVLNDLLLNGVVTLVYDNVSAGGPYFQMQSQVGNAVGSGTVTTTGTMTSTALVTSAGTTVIQTPSATATLDASGNMSIPGTLGVTGHVTLEGTTSTGSTGSNNLVFANSPALTTPKMNAIKDANGNPFIAVSATASAVDGVTVTNGATGNPGTVGIAPTSVVDTNINLALSGKGGGVVTVNKVTLTAPATSSTITVADGKTFTASNTITLTATDGASLNVSNAATMAANGTSGNLIKSAGADKTQSDSGVAAADVVTYHTPAAGIARTAAGSQAIAGSELSGDCTTSGSNAVTCLPSVFLSTSSPVTVSTTASAAFYNNQHATAATAMTFNLPTAAAGKQFCFTNSYNGSAANTGALTLQASATGQYIIFTDGTLSASNGYVSSAGAASDAACVVGVDTTHWQLYVQRGTWAKH